MSMPRKPSIKSIIKGSKTARMLKKSPSAKMLVKMAKSAKKLYDLSRPKRTKLKSSGNPLEPIKNIKVYKQNIKIRNKRLEDALKGKF